MREREVRRRRGVEGGKGKEGLTIVESGEAKKQIVKKLQMIPSCANMVDVSLTNIE